MAFEGNSKIKGDQLAVEVQSKSRSGFNDAVATADIDRIKDAYKKFGRSASTVTYRLVTLPNGRVDLVFTIDEGDKTGVKKSSFSATNISSYRLHGLMQTTEMNFLSFFKTSDVYDPDKVASDEERSANITCGTATPTSASPTPRSSTIRPATSSPSPWTRARSIMCPA